MFSKDRRTAWASSARRAGHGVPIGANVFGVLVRARGVVLAVIRGEKSGSREDVDVVSGLKPLVVL